MVKRRSISYVQERVSRNICAAVTRIKTRGMAMCLTRSRRCLSIKADRLKVQLSFHGRSKVPMYPGIWPPPKLIAYYYCGMQLHKIISASSHVLQGCPWKFPAASGKAEKSRLVEERHALLYLHSPLCTTTNTSSPDNTAHSKVLFLVQISSQNVSPSSVSHYPFCIRQTSC